MKNLEQQFSEDLLITKSSNSVRKYSDPIPVDLLIDILSRVPKKSIARFRCVSKFWEFILRRHDFTELFLTKSVARPRLFFAVKVNEELLVFSSPQNPNDNSSLVATRYKSFPKYFSTQICTPLYGLIFLQNLQRKALVICNPDTGKSITLPRVKATGIGDSYLGFDPISKQFKVLCMTWSRYGTPNTHRVLTLMTGKCLWRTIQDPLHIPHHRRYGREICINGVLYYEAYIEGSNKIVCFDFRFEKFSLINMDKDMARWFQLNLFNNKGKLGGYKFSDWRSRDRLELWVLEDAGKHKWSKSICLLPEIILNISNRIVGMTGTGEIVFRSFDPSKSFYIYYYNVEGKTLTRVDIKGFEEFKHHSIRIFLDYVESVNFM